MAKSFNFHSNFYTTFILLALKFRSLSLLLFFRTPKMMSVFMFKQTQ